MRRDADLWRSKIWRFFFFFITPGIEVPLHPQEKGDETSSPIKSTSIRVHLETGHLLSYCGAKVQSLFYPEDWKIHSVSGRLPDYPGELACMLARKINNKLAHYNH